MSFNPQKEQQYKSELLGQLTALLPKKVDDKDEIDTLPQGLRLVGRNLRTLRDRLQASLEERKTDPTFYEAYQAVVTARRYLSQQPEVALITKINQIVSSDQYRMYCSNTDAARIVYEQYVRFDKLRELKLPVNPKTVNTCAAQKDLLAFHTRHLALQAHFKELQVQEEKTFKGLDAEAQKKFEKRYEAGPDYFDLRDFEDTIVAVLEKSLKDPEFNDFSRGVMGIINVRSNLLLHLYSRAKLDYAQAQEKVKELMTEKQELLSKFQSMVEAAQTQAAAVQALEAQVAELDRQAKTATELGKVSIELDQKLTAARSELSVAVGRDQFEGLKGLLAVESEKAKENARLLAVAEEEKQASETREKLLREEVLRQSLDAEKERAEAEKREAQMKERLAMLESKRAADKQKIKAKDSLLHERRLALGLRDEQIKRLEAENEELSEWKASVSEAGGKSESEVGSKGGLGKREKELEALTPFVSELRRAILLELSRFGDLNKTSGKPNNSKQKYIAKIMSELLRYEGDTQSYFENCKTWQAFRKGTLKSSKDYSFMILGFQGVKALLPDDLELRLNDKVGEVDKVQKWTLMSNMFNATCRLIPWVSYKKEFSELAQAEKVFADQTNVSKLTREEHRAKVEGQASAADTSTIDDQSQSVTNVPN